MSIRLLLPIALVAGLLAGLIAVVSCATDSVTGEKRFSVQNWTIEEEVAFGAKAAPNIESEFDAVYPDQEANEYLQGLIDELVSHSPRRRDLTWRFRILNTSQKNAFALPGGFVYITRGLLERLQTEAEFVFALGHEIGHVEHRHTMLQQSRKTVAGVFWAPVTVPINAVTSVATGPGGRVIGAVGRLITAPSTLLLAKYSRSHETEADLRGLYFASEMGFDPRDSNILFEYFQLEEKKHGGARGGWLRTHPLTEDRITRVNEVIKEKYPKPPTLRDSSPEFKAIVAKLKKHSKAYQNYDVGMALLFKAKPNEFELKEAKGLLERAVRTYPDEPLFRVGLGEEAILRKDAETARKHLTAAARQYEERMPGEAHWKAYFYIGFLDVKDKRGATAVRALERARELFPMQPPIHFYLGEAYMLTGRTADAKAEYEKVLQLVPRGHELAKKAKDRLSRL